MNWLEYQFRKAGEDPRFYSIVKVLRASKILSNFRRVFFVSAFKYTDNDYLRLKQSLKDNSVVKFLSTVSYNSQEDDVEVYLVQTTDDLYMLCYLDRVELFAGDAVLDIIKCSPGDCRQAAA